MPTPTPTKSKRHSLSTLLTLPQITGLSISLLDDTPSKNTGSNKKDTSPFPPDTRKRENRKSLPLDFLSMTNGSSKSSNRKSVDFLSLTSSKIGRDGEKSGDAKQAPFLEHASLRKSNPKRTSIFRDPEPKMAPFPHSPGTPRGFPKPERSATAPIPAPTPKRKKRETIKDFGRALFARKLSTNSRSNREDAENRSQGRTPLREKDKNGVVTVQPPRGLRLRNLGKGDERLRHEKHDSSFSSISSSLDDLLYHSQYSTSSRPNSKSKGSKHLYQPQNQTIFLYATELEKMKLLLGKMEQELLKMGKSHEGFSQNILWLFAVKENMIQESKRLNVEWKRGLVGEIDEVREELGRVFSRKNALVRRGLASLRAVQVELGFAPPPPSISKGNAKSEPECKSLPMKGGKFEVSTGKLEELLKTLAKDFELQRILNECIIDAITRKCWKTRWVKTGSQRVEMRRFVGFVVGRIEVANSTLKVSRSLVEGVDGVVLRGIGM